MALQENANNKKIDDYLKLIDQIEVVRSKNNVNWMDILRIAFRHCPEEAKEVLLKIHSKDKEIAGLLDKLAQI